MALRKRLKTKVLQLRVTPETKERLKAEANKKGVSVIAIIEEALGQYFGEKSVLIDAIKKLDERIKALEEKDQNQKR